jgi:hypothetical protein
MKVAVGVLFHVNHSFIHSPKTLIELIWPLSDISEFSKCVKEKMGLKGRWKTV